MPPTETKRPVPWNGHLVTVPPSHYYSTLHRLRFCPGSITCLLSRFYCCICLSKKARLSQAGITRNNLSPGGGMQLAGESQKSCIPLLQQNQLSASPCSACLSLQMEAGTRLLLFKECIYSIFLQKEQQQTSNVQKLQGAFSASGTAVQRQHCKRSAISSALSHLMCHVLT